MLDVSGLTVSYDGFQFGPVDLTVDDEVLSVLGPSGSGKTTLLSAIAGIVRPDAGTISLDGTSLDGRPLRERRTGLVFQDGALFPHMTARENVAYAAADPARVAEFAATFEIRDVLDRRPAALSGGERQRVALARTLAADPDVLLLDEPLSSLDAPIRRRLRGELRALFASLDVPVVHVTHDQRTATAVGDRTAVFRDGTVEQVAPPTTVIDRPATRFVARFTGTENVLDATVVDRRADATVLRVGDVEFRATAGSETGTPTLCVHPSRIRVDVPGGGAGGENRVAGTVDQWVHEGDDYRVAVAVDDAPVTLVAAMRPSRFDRLGLEPGAAVLASVPPGAIHLIE
jgi:molybdate/tungstate transport system ATP-binding protein